MATIREGAILEAYRKRSHEVDTIDDIRKLDLRDIDKTMPNINLAYTAAATVEGAAAGFTLSGGEIIAGGGAVFGAGAGAAPGIGMVVGVRQCCVERAQAHGQRNTAARCRVCRVQGPTRGHSHCPLRGRGPRSTVHLSARSQRAQFRSPLVLFAFAAAMCLVLTGCGGGAGSDAGGAGSGGHASSKTRKPAGASMVGTLSANEQDTCQVVSGAVRCWGLNSSGELGTGTNKGPQQCDDLAFDTKNACATTPVATQGLPQVSQVSVGLSTTCALALSKKVYCWGSNSDGSLGQGSNTGPENCGETGACSTKPLVVPRLPAAVSLSVGGPAGGLDASACAVGSDGSVSCWGDNSEGALGIGSLDGANGCNNAIGGASVPCVPSPTRVVGISDAVSVSSGAGFACAVHSTGHVSCWGANNNGTLGNGSHNGPRACSARAGGAQLDCSPRPVEVSRLGDASQVSAGGAAACALTSGGEVYCWGADAGVIGQGAPAKQTCDAALGFKMPCADTPQKVTSLPKATAVSVGGAAACAVTSTKQVWCWGENDTGELGTGKTTGPESCPNQSGLDPVACTRTPLQVSGISDADSVAAGFDHTCVRRAGGKVTCWGNNTDGVVGDATTGGPDTCQLNAYVNDSTPSCVAKPGHDVADR